MGFPDFVRTSWATAINVKKKFDEQSNGFNGADSLIVKAATKSAKGTKASDRLLKRRGKAVPANQSIAEFLVRNVNKKQKVAEKGRRLFLNKTDGKDENEGC